MALDTHVGVAGQSNSPAGGTEFALGDSRHPSTPSMPPGECASLLHTHVTPRLTIGWKGIVFGASSSTSSRLTCMAPRAEFSGRSSQWHQTTHRCSHLWPGGSKPLWFPQVFATLEVAQGEDALPWAQWKGSHVVHTTTSQRRIGGAALAAGLCAGHCSMPG